MCGLMFIIHDMTHGEGRRARECLCSAFACCAAYACFRSSIKSIYNLLFNKSVLFGVFEYVVLCATLTSNQMSIHAFSHTRTRQSKTHDNFPPVGARRKCGADAEEWSSAWFARRCNSPMHINTPLSLSRQLGHGVDQFNPSRRRERSLIFRD